MAWPDEQTKANFDEGADDPKQARPEFADNVDKFNLLRNHPSSLSRTLLALATAAGWRSNLDAQQTISALTEETAPAAGDFLGLRDTSASADRRMTLANALKVINGLNELTTVDGANDFLPIFDLSAGTAKKVKPDNLGGVFSESFTSAEQTITSGGLLNIAHGLSAKPEMVQARLVCKTAELGYSIGNELIVNPHMAEGSSRGQSIRAASASEITVRYGSEANVYNLLRADTGALDSATNGNWRLVVRAWR